MADERFLQLADAFSDLSFEIDSNDEITLFTRMSQAGKLLCKSIQSGFMANVKLPTWLTTVQTAEVLRTNRKGESVDVTIETWDTYWWHSIVWLSEKFDDSLIVLPLVVKKTIHEPFIDSKGKKRNPHWQDDFDRIVYSLINSSFDFKDANQFRTLYKEIARSSKDACSFIIRYSSNYFHKGKLTVLLDKKEIRYGETNGIMGGSVSWKIFADLIRAGGSPVSDVKISEADEGYEHVARLRISGLKKHLEKIGFDELSKAIDRRGAGYCLDFTLLE